MLGSTGAHYGWSDKPAFSVPHYTPPSPCLPPSLPLSSPSLTSPFIFTHSPHTFPSQVLVKLVHDSGERALRCLRWVKARHPEIINMREPDSNRSFLQVRTI